MTRLRRLVPHPNLILMQGEKNRSYKIDLLRDSIIALKSGLNRDIKF